MTPEEKEILVKVLGHLQKMAQDPEVDELCDKIVGMVGRGKTSVDELCDKIELLMKES